MRYKAIFLAGLAVGFIAGARDGRERYDQLVKLGKQAAGHPAVQNARHTATAKATDLTKTAAAKAPELAKTAAPKLVGAAKTAAGRLPFTGKGGDADAPFEEASDSGDAKVPYQADSTSATFNGVRAD